MQDYFSELALEEALRRRLGITSYLAASNLGVEVAIE